MSLVKEYFKKLANKNRLIAPVYFYITLPYFTRKFIEQINNNSIFDINDLESMEWKRRIHNVVACPDNQDIKRCDNAGTIIDNKLIMHNGIVVHPLSYYGKYILKMLVDNKGVHEPQEEKAFQEVLKEIPENGVMMELGSYWAFYSLWFNKQIKGSKNYMIEPNPICLQSGKLNFRINKRFGIFFNNYIGKTYVKAPTPRVSIDYLINKYNIKHLHILHSDIQGNELEMLSGSEEAIKANRISYFFISTHSNELHEKCSDFLKRKQFDIIASANCSQSYSVDGIIVAKAPFVSKPEKIIISLMQ